MILGEAYRYISELKQQNDEMLLNGGDKVQGKRFLLLWLVGCAFRFPGIWALERCNSIAFVLFLTDYEFEGQQCHSHLLPKVQESVSQCLIGI